MLPETPVTKPEADGYIVHWAQWWGITEQALLGHAAGTDSRRHAVRQHEQAKQNLRNSLGISGKGPHHG